MHTLRITKNNQSYIDDDTQRKYFYVGGLSENSPAILNGTTTVCVVLM